MFTCAHEQEITPGTFTLVISIQPYGSRVQRLNQRLRAPRHLKWTITHCKRVLQLDSFTVVPCAPEQILKRSSRLL